MALLVSAIDARAGADVGRHPPVGDTSARGLVASYISLARCFSNQPKKLAEIITDEFLLRAYQRTSGDQRAAEADALIAEIERRGLTFEP